MLQYFSAHDADTETLSGIASDVNTALRTPVSGQRRRTHPAAVGCTAHPHHSSGGGGIRNLVR